MGAALLITLREGVEAALVIGIVLGVLSRLNLHHLKRYAWAGTLTAVALSLGVGVALYTLGVELEGRAEEIFEGAMMLAAAVLLTWMIFWMKVHGRELARQLEEETRAAASVGVTALFGVTFFAVLREGLETALFLIATTFKASAVSTLVGGLIGLALAIGIGVLIFTASVRLNLRTFFNVTGVLLLLVAAGLVAQGVHEFQEAGLLPVFIEHVWDINFILDENSTLGSFLKALFGYNGNPSLLEVLAYAIYFVTVGLAAKPADVSLRKVTA